jgi:membrane carboxypeptidase/penicillin-binding protein
MRSALAGKPAEDFHKPETVVSVRVDPSAGYLATPGCPQQRDEYFVSGTEPTEYCPSHGGPVIPPVEAGETVEPGDSVRPGTTDDIGGTFPE